MWRSPSPTRALACLRSTCHGYSILILPPNRRVAAEEAPATPLQGTGRVLVMDDDEVIRNVAKRMLELLGYQVELAGDGDEALELYRSAMRSGESFHAVLMDLTITEGQGSQETIKKLLVMDPASPGRVFERLLQRSDHVGISGLWV